MRMTRERMVFKLATIFVSQFPITEVFATQLAIDTINALEKELAKDVPEQIG